MDIISPDKLEGLAQYLAGLAGVAEAVQLDVTTLRQVLVDTEEGVEPFDLHVRKVLHPFDIGIGGVHIIGGDGDDLVVGLSVVDHPQHADGPDLDHRSG